MEAIDEQEFVEFDEDENDNVIYRYIRYIDRIEIDKISAFFVIIYKNGTFKFKPQKQNGFGDEKINLNKKRLVLSKKYDYYRIKNFMESNASDKSKFSYLHKMTDELFDIAKD